MKRIKSLIVSAVDYRRKLNSNVIILLFTIIGGIVGILSLLFGQGIWINLTASETPLAGTPNEETFRSKMPSEIGDVPDYDPLKHEIPMRYIPAGNFLMGADAQLSLQKCQNYRNDCSLNFFKDEEPEHTVYLDAFYIDKYEVTNFLYTSCVSAGVCDPQSQGDPDPQYNDYPVRFVNWFMANKYCQWRGARLPSEAQWEKAARGTGKPARIFPWGNEIDCSRANYWDGTNGKHCVGFPTKVGSYPKGLSPYGVYDMAGNVWEWTSSLYMPYPYNSNDGREDLMASGSRVARGGGWFFYSGGLPTTTDRFPFDPTESDNSDFGFRCVHLTP
jgi:eukaryotic-like serine/threonine-protein kinase